MHDLPGPQELDDIVDVRVVGQAQDVVVGNPGLLLGGQVLRQVGDQVALDGHGRRVPRGAGGGGGIHPGGVIHKIRLVSRLFDLLKYEDKREVFGLKIHSFSTLDRIKKYDDSDNEKNAEKPYSIKVGETKRTINLYAIATTKFQIAV